MKVKKYHEPDGPIEELIPIVPLTGLTRRQIKQNAIGNARDENFTNDYLNSRISVGGNRRWHQRYHDRHFNRERNRIVREREKSEVDRQVAEMMSNNDWFYRSIGGGRPEHPASIHGREYVQPLMDAASIGIGGTMGFTNPITTTLAPELLRGAGHTFKVMMNPLSAKTTTGALLGTAADAYLTATGVQRNSQLINNWRNKYFNWSDVPEFILNTVSLIPTASVAAKTADRTMDAFSGFNKMKTFRNPTTSIDAPMRAPSVDTGTKPGFSEHMDKIMQWRRSKGIPDETPLSIDDLKGYVGELGSNGSITQSDLNLRTNFNENIDDLIQTTSYHPALSPEEIVKEFDLMSQSSIPVRNQVADIRDFYASDALPRLLKAISDSGIQLDPQDLDEIIKIYSNPFDGTDFNIGYLVPGWEGVSIGPNVIRYSNRSFKHPTQISTSTISHEIHHNLRAKLANILMKYNPDLTESVLGSVQSLNPARNLQSMFKFVPTEFDKMQPLRMSHNFTQYLSPAEEIGAVLSGEGRFAIWQGLKNANNGKFPPIEQVDMAIDRLPDSNILNSSFWTYGTQIGSDAKSVMSAMDAKSTPTGYIKSSLQSGRIPWRPWKWSKHYKSQKEDYQRQFVQAWKDAMKYIGGVGAVGAVGAQSLQNNQNEN